LSTTLASVTTAHLATREGNQCRCRCQQKSSPRRTIANTASITSSASLIHTQTSTTPETCFIQIPATSPIVYLGPSGVSTSNGLACGPGSKIYLSGSYGQSIYGIVASGSVTITWQAITS
jgi:hypothetical protein